MRRACRRGLELPSWWQSPSAAGCGTPGPVGSSQRSRVDVPHPSGQPGTSRLLGGHGVSRPVHAGRAGLASVATGLAWGKLSGLAWRPANTLDGRDAGRRSADRRSIARNQFRKPTRFVINRERAWPTRLVDWYRLDETPVCPRSGLKLARRADDGRPGPKRTALGRARRYPDDRGGGEAPQGVGEDSRAVAGPAADSLRGIPEAGGLGSHPVPASGYSGVAEAAGREGEP